MKLLARNEKAPLFPFALQIEAMQHQIEQNPFKAVKKMSEVMPTTIIMDR